MRKILLSLLLVGLMALPAFAQCGPWGCPVQRQPAPRVKIKEKTKIKRPIPAWRYERPVGYRAAVVRIHCHDGVRKWSKGSGVLVRWGRRIVILTARHVVKNAKRILVDFHNGRRCRARVLKVNARWDCAVLDIGTSPDGIDPAEFAFGEDARFHDGDRLESCGYGPDGKLAVNSGLFKGYRRSTAAIQGPDDWMIISGHARGGDSGGPVFDRQGRVVGVLWGTDGREVVCVQPGRVHALLDEAVAQTYEQRQIFQRNPTPPAIGPLEPVDQAKLAGGGKTLLPWRGKSEATDKAQDARIDKLIGLMEGQVRVRPGPSVDVQVGRQPGKPLANERSPLLGGLCVILGVVGGFVIYFANQKGE